MTGAVGEKRAKSRSESGAVGRGPAQINARLRASM